MAPRMLDKLSWQKLTEGLSLESSQARTLAVTAGVVGLLAGLEFGNRGVSRTLRGCKRICSAIILEWAEDRGGLTLWTLDDDDASLLSPPDDKNDRLPWQTPEAAAQTALLSQKHSPSPSIKSAGGSSEGLALTPSNSVGSGLAAGKRRSKSFESVDTTASDIPALFASTKFFSCLDLHETRELFEAAEMIAVEPDALLFEAGDASEDGTYIVVEGALGVFLAESTTLLHTNTLLPGESIGDFDVLDGGLRGVTCVAMDEGCVLLQITRPLFLQFIAAKPRTLQIYLQKAMARMWRVAHFVLSDFLQLPLQPPSSASQSADLQRLPQLAQDLQLPGPPSLARSSPTDSITSATTTAPSGPMPVQMQSPFAAPQAQGEQHSGNGPATSGSLERQGSSNGSSKFSAQADVLSHKLSLQLSTLQSMPDPLPEPAPALSHMPAVSEHPTAGTGNGDAADSASAEQHLAGAGHRLDATATASTSAASAPNSMARVGSMAAGPIENLPLVLPHTQTDFSSIHPSRPPTVLLEGWDVMSPGESGLKPEVWGRLSEAGGPFAGAPGKSIALNDAQVLFGKDKRCPQFFILLEGQMMARAHPKGCPSRLATVVPGSLIGCAAYLTSTRTRCSVRSIGRTRLLAYGRAELEALLAYSRDAFVELLLAAGRAMGPVLRRFNCLGLNRVWLDSGDTIFLQDEPADSVFILISGRVRLLQEEPGGLVPIRVAEEVGRGEAVGAVWALAGGNHDTTALCIRDSELVRMSKGAFEVIGQESPQSVALMLKSMARRLAAVSIARTVTPSWDLSGKARMGAVPPAHSGPATDSGSKRRGDIVTIALVPAGEVVRGTAAAVHEAACALKGALEKAFGPTLHLTPRTMATMFPNACERLSVGFYRSKVTSWMAAQEEDFRFILLEADTEETDWSHICIAQADCTLLIASPGSKPEVGALEHQLLWAAMGTPEPDKTDSGTSTVLANSAQAAGRNVQSGSNSSGELTMRRAQTAAEVLLDEINRISDAAAGATAEPDEEERGKNRRWIAHFRRVELVMLHAPTAEPEGTAAWLQARPHLSRHHHVRLAYEKDLARVARWMAGKAVGLVLSGGGSRGLAHLGVLHALDDAGVPVDVVGGTSQGAFMAGLYAQGLAWEEMHAVVREYARQMGSVRHLLQDMTLPVISVFSGAKFDGGIREAFARGAQHIEDLWLQFFCITTNLSKGEPGVHDKGLLWRLVRASMTIVGLVPPVYEEGDLLVDGGYLNNCPVDVMRGMGVDTVIVVDVEDRDDSAWQNLTPYDGGLSGWRLLWERWCPFPSLRYGIKLPRYSQIVNALTWMSHAQNLRRASREYVIDLYLRPPVTRFKLMDFHLIDRIVREANTYARGAISKWQGRQGMLRTRTLQLGDVQRRRSIGCMTQLQAKQAAADAADGLGQLSAADSRAATEDEEIDEAAPDRDRNASAESSAEDLLAVMAAAEAEVAASSVPRPMAPSPFANQSAFPSDNGGWASPSSTSSSSQLSRANSAARPCPPAKSALRRAPTPAAPLGTAAGRGPVLAPIRRLDTPALPLARAGAAAKVSWAEAPAGPVSLTQRQRKASGELPPLRLQRPTSQRLPDSIGAVAGPPALGRQSPLPPPKRLSSATWRISQGPGGLPDDMRSSATGLMTISEEDVAQMALALTRSGSAVLEGDRPGAGEFPAHSGRPFRAGSGELPAQVAPAPPKSILKRKTSPE